MSERVQRMHAFAANSCMRSRLLLYLAVVARGALSDVINAHDDERLCLP